MSHLPCPGFEAVNLRTDSDVFKHFAMLFQMIEFGKDSLDCEFASRPVNAEKNRPGAVLPVFRSRVPLCKRTSAEGSDYINASFIQVSVSRVVYASCMRLLKSN